MNDGALHKAHRRGGRRYLNADHRSARRTSRARLSFRLQRKRVPRPGGSRDSSAMRASGHAGKVAEGGGVGAEHRAVGGFGRCGDDQVVGAAGFALRAGRDKQFGVRFGDLDVVVDDRNGGDDVFEVCGPGDLCLGAARRVPTRSSATVIAAIAMSSSSLMTSSRFSPDRSVSIKNVVSKRRRVMHGHRSRGARGPHQDRPSNHGPGRVGARGASRLRRGPDSSARGGRWLCLVARS